MMKKYLLIGMMVSVILLISLISYTGILDFKNSKETVTEISLDKKYSEIQDSIQPILAKMYNGQYHGDDPENALKKLQDARSGLQTILDQYNSLDNSLKTDKTVGMRFFNLGKMGFASMDSQIAAIERQIAMPTK
ncbi:MAG: hypothetical protein ACREA1_05580 [Nitrosotalea sp.]